MERVLVVFGSVIIATLGVAKAWLEFAATKAKTRANENGDPTKDNPRS